MFGVFRFGLALNVMAFHILKVPNIGPFAVYSFFILSGFLMTTIMHESYGFNLRGLRKYSLNRFLRLYPTHWALLIITTIIIFITGDEYAHSINGAFRLPGNYFEYITNITLIFPAWNPIDVSLRLSPSSWALTIEIFYYCLIGIGLSKNKKITLIWFCLSIVYLCFYMVLNKTYGAGYGNFLAASLPFSIGGMIYHYKLEIFTICKKITVKYGHVVTLLFILNLVMCATSHKWAPEEYWKVNVVGMYFNLLLSSILIVFLFYGGKKYFSKKIDKFYGDLSYPLYLFHWSAACICSWLLIGEPIKEITANNVIVFFVALLFTIFISILVNFSVNTPIEKMRHRIKNNKVNLEKHSKKVITS